jgi:hypothetical protein
MTRSVCRARRTRAGSFAARHRCQLPAVAKESSPEGPQRSGGGAQRLDDFFAEAMPLTRTVTGSRSSTYARTTALRAIETPRFPTVVSTLSPIDALDRRPRGVSQGHLQSLETLPSVTLGRGLLFAPLQQHRHGRFAIQFCGVKRGTALYRTRSAACRTACQVDAMTARLCERYGLG